ncbi:MAG: hypothetical protein Q7T36_17890 [Fluviicoccus sp.]|uniref:hypothetical protein n=1 Tax=Fluviicoccus sp. TaxID=2003552 RepID=UPI002722888C|nr:hypothetical protein [Fluviicoccus sp.]MDO8332338.1 hypothetical protein [Fluviicoccus sp.]
MPSDALAVVGIELALMKVQVQVQVQVQAIEYEEKEALLELSEATLAEQAPRPVRHERKMHKPRHRERPKECSLRFFSQVDCLFHHAKSMFPALSLRLLFRLNNIDFHH